MEAFRASKKSASAWRGELSSNSMVETKASAMAWSDTARPRSRERLSNRIVDLRDDRPQFSPDQIRSLFCSSGWQYLKCPVVATWRTRIGKRARTGLYSPPVVVSSCRRLCRWQHSR